MIKLSDVTVGKKPALLSGVFLCLLACTSGLALWVLNDASAAAAKAQHYAYELNLVDRVNASLSEIALRTGNVLSSRHVSRDVELVTVARKQYMDALEYLKSSATTDEDRALLRKIEEAVAPWRDLNIRVVQAVQAGKRLDAAKVREETVAHLDAAHSAVAEYMKYRQIRLDLFQKEEQATVSRVVALLESAADGNLVLDVTGQSLVRKDEIGMLGRAIQKMSTGLRDSVQSIHQGIGVLSSSSAELSANSGRMTSGSQEASGKAHAVAATAEQTTATIGEIAGNSEKARRITEISSQTNLLALNATIEAARATDDIKGRIAGMQSSTAGGIAEID